MDVKAVSSVRILFVGVREEVDEEAEERLDVLDILRGEWKCCRSADNVKVDFGTEVSLADSC